MACAGRLNAMASAVHVFRKDFIVTSPIVAGIALGRRRGTRTLNVTGSARIRKFIYQKGDIGFSDTVW
jgi:hypothetical protein